MTTPLTSSGEVPIPVEGTTYGQEALRYEEKVVPIEGTGPYMAGTGAAAQVGGPMEPQQMPLQEPVPLQQPLAQEPVPLQQQPAVQQAGDVDAITLLTNDHREVMNLYDQYIQATDLNVKQRIGHDIVRELCIHASIEERVLYPAMRDRLQPDGKVLAERALQEHILIEKRLDQLDNFKIHQNEAEYSAQLAQAISDFKTHSTEEETFLFTNMRAQWDQQYLLNLGRKLRKARRTAPTRPHPKLPKEGIMGKMGGTVAGVYDRVADRITKT